MFFFRDAKGRGGAGGYMAPTTHYRIWGLEGNGSARPTIRWKPMAPLGSTGRTTSRVAKTSSSKEKKNHASIGVASASTPSPHVAMASTLAAAHALPWRQIDAEKEKLAGHKNPKNMASITQIYKNTTSWPNNQQIAAYLEMTRTK